MMRRWSMGKGWWIRCCTCAVGRDNTHCYSSAMQLQRQGAMTTRQPVERIKRFRNGRRLAACVWQRVGKKVVVRLSQVRGTLKASQPRAPSVYSYVFNHSFPEIQTQNLLYPTKKKPPPNR